MSKRIDQLISQATIQLDNFGLIKTDLEAEMMEEGIDVPAFYDNYENI